MYAESFSLEKYCDRVGFDGECRVDLATLTALMRSQLLAIPFENLDVQAGKLVSLDLNDIAKKILCSSRGGYCYEVNSLFAMALAAVGFDYYLVGARPMFYQDRRAKTHMVVIVRLAGNEYLCDLGFGSFGIRAPIALSNINTPITQDYDQFMLRCDDACLYVLQAWVGGAWVSQFGFDLYPHELVDFVPANFFNSKSPEAIFVQKLLLVKYTATGRKILLGTSLKTYEKGQCEIRELEASEVAGVLKVEFDLDIH